MCSCKKKTYTESEKVVRYIVVANLLQGGKKAADKVAQIPLSNDTMKRRSAIIVEDLRQKQMVILCSSV